MDRLQNHEEGAQTRTRRSRARRQGFRGLVGRWAWLATVVTAWPGPATATGLDLDWLNHPIQAAGPAVADQIGADFATLQREGGLARLTELTDPPGRSAPLDPARLRAAIDSPMLLLRVAAASRPDLSREMVERILGRREPAVLRALVSNSAIRLTDADRVVLRSAGDADIRAWLDREAGQARSRTAPAASAPQPPIEQARLALATDGFDAAFRITQRTDFQPTAEEVARGLASAEPRLRRLWYGLARYRISPEQVEAGLTDPDPGVREFTLARADVRPTPFQLDRACSDAEFSVRYRCVQRPDVELTQARFERLLLDPNPNMLGVFRSGRRALSDAQWAPYADAVLAGGSAGLRLALARSPLPLTPEQMQRGGRSVEPEVRQAYCARRLMLCAASP